MSATSKIAAAMEKRRRKLDAWLKAHHGEWVSGPIFWKITRHLRTTSGRLVTQRAAGEVVVLDYPEPKLDD